MTLEGELIRLRAVEPEDAELIHTWENDPDVWAVSGTTEPFSREQIRQFVERQLRGGDLFRSGQLRLMIETRGASEGTGKRTNQEACKDSLGAGEGACKASNEAGEETGAAWIDGAGTKTGTPGAEGNIGAPGAEDKIGTVPHSARTVGTVDLFEYDPLHSRAGLGILIYGSENLRRGYARDAVETLCRYARERLRLHQLWCSVTADNTASLELFRKAGFIESGTKRDWLWSPEGYLDEILFQKILD